MVGLPGVVVVGKLGWLLLNLDGEPPPPLLLLEEEEEEEGRWLRAGDGGALGKLAGETPPEDGWGLPAPLPHS